MVIKRTITAKRTRGPLAEGQTLAFCGRCANFQTVHLPHNLSGNRMIRVNNVTLSFGKRVLFDEVNLTFNNFHGIITRDMEITFHAMTDTEGDVLVSVISGEREYWLEGDFADFNCNSDDCCCGEGVSHQLPESMVEEIVKTGKLELNGKYPR